MHKNIAQYITLVDLMKAHKTSFRIIQQDALVGMERKLLKGDCDSCTEKRIMGLFKYLQKNMATNEA
jgi:hypothetical protein|tara:strand:+ start:477 stop:677 length:201 start_codon:yes stop_codon:yes gene_type:complete